ncbi:FAD-binding domain-containing protein 71 [Elsinoe fawcettii]|nr:FAD-binding domain-containing protein 71 [Elsinoe fawcettii]
MRLQSLAVVASLLHVTLGQADTSFENANFNAIDALKGLDVDVSTLPGVGNGGRTISPCASACAALTALYGQERVLAQNTPSYTNFSTSYYSFIQRDVRPFCVFKPADDKAVSVVVLLSRLTQCPFAVKSGGHAMFEGSSSFEGGITVSLESFNGISVSADKNVASVGAGLRWGPTYAKLAEQDLTVLGGRLFSIGVGGLTTGGGISYFANLRGWGCDNVASYDVITASGIKVNASPKNNPDLYWALRGGGPNFGIVTQFNFETLSVPGTDLWGGSRIFLETEFSAVLRAFTNVGNNSPQDRYAGQWIVWTINNGTKIASTELWYGKPGGDQAEIFQEYLAIPAISSSTQNRKLVEYSKSNDSPGSQRVIYYVMTFKNDEAMNNIAKDIFFEAAEKAGALRGGQLLAVFQSITVPQIENMAKNGGNPLGLKPEDGPLTLFLINLFWQDAADDDAIITLASDCLKAVKAEAVARGLASDFVYMNYAAEFQDVIASYGAENKARLQQIAKKYDPQGVFQKLSPGYFKLDRPATPGTDRFSF